MYSPCRKRLNRQNSQNILIPRSYYHIITSLSADISGLFSISPISCENVTAEACVWIITQYSKSRQKFPWQQKARRRPALVSRQTSGRNSLWLETGIFFTLRKKFVYFRIILVHVVGLRIRGWCNFLALLTFWLSCSLSKCCMSSFHRKNVTTSPAKEHSLS